MSSEIEREKSRQERVKRQGEAFIAEMKEIMARHGVDEVCVEMESGHGFEGYVGAHINIEFTGKYEDDSYFYGTHEVTRIG